MTSPVSTQPRPALLCGQYHIDFVGAPGGPGWSGANSVISLPPYEHDGRWGQRLNNTAGAEVTIDCCNFPDILKVLDWAHYMRVSRTGYNAPLFWGPVTGAREPESAVDPDGTTISNGDLITIEAADPTAWWYEVGLGTDYVTGGLFDSSVLFTELHRRSELRNYSGLTLSIAPTGHNAEAAYMQSEGRQIGDYIDSITGHSIDWTVAGQTLIAGAYAIPLGTRTIETNGWVTKPSARRVGAEMSSSVEAFGRHDTHQAFPGFGNIDPVYGVHESFLVDDDLEDNPSALRLAESTYQHEKRPPVYQNASTGGLNEFAGVDFEDLIAGRLFAVNSGVKLEQGLVTKRLHELDVEWRAGIETRVLPKLEPIGQT